MDPNVISKPTRLRSIIMWESIYHPHLQSLLQNINQFLYSHDYEKIEYDDFVQFMYEYSSRG